VETLPGAPVRRILACHVLLLTLSFGLHSNAEVVLQPLYEFQHDMANGGFPLGSLAEGSDGWFYGCTQSGGAHGQGTVYKFRPGGPLTNLHTFTYDEGAPRGVTFGGDGLLYGVANGGGPVRGGTAFTISTEGAFSTLFSFEGTNGANPVPHLVLGTDGFLYGTTAGGGEQEAGTIFRISTNGTLTTLYSFTIMNGNVPAPSSPVLQTADGSLYGTTSRGGLYDLGTVFKLGTNSTFSTLVHFDATNGSYPLTGLTLGTDGSLYGTTWFGGAFNRGTIFRLTSIQTLETVITFDGTNGARPMGPLTRALDGALYGTTSQRLSGTNWTPGSVFQLSSNGAMHSVALFSGSSETRAFLELSLASDGALYGGLLDAGGSPFPGDSAGQIVRLVEPPRIVSIIPKHNSVTITWTSITNALYRVEQKAALSDPQWSAISSNVIGTGSLCQFAFSSPQSSHNFFRAVLLP